MLARYLALIRFIAMFLSSQQPRTLTLKWLQRNRLPNDWQAQRMIIERFD